MRKIEGVILDLEGTLIDANDGRVESWAEAFKLNGHPVPATDLRPLVGMVAHELMVRVVGFGEETELGRKIRDQARHILVRRYVPRFYPVYRAAELLARFDLDGLRLGVFSVDGPEVLYPMLKLLNAEPLAQRAGVPPVDGMVTTRDLLKQTLDKLGLPAARVAVLADAPHDVDAALKLGLTPIALRSGGFDTFQKNVAVYADVRALLADYATSPLTATAA